TEVGLGDHLTALAWMLGRQGTDQGLLIARDHYFRLGGHPPDARRSEAKLLRRLGGSSRPLLRTPVGVVWLCRLGLVCSDGRLAEVHHNDRVSRSLTGRAIRRCPGLPADKDVNLHSRDAVRARDPAPRIETFARRPSRRGGSAHT